MTGRREIMHAIGLLAIVVFGLVLGIEIGVIARESLGWNRMSAQSAYWCGIVRGSRRAENLPQEMPNNEAECSMLEHALESR